MVRPKTQCNIQRFIAQRPNIKFQSEGGITEFWDSNNSEFEYAGIEIARKTIHPKGLLLPHCTNVPKLVYIVQGHGVQGTMIPGCAETVKLTENIGHPTRADVFNPRASSISTANSQTLPILGWLQLSAERGFLYSVGNEGFEYIALKTNDHAMTSQLAGRLSTIRAIPEEVLMSSYQISRKSRI
ncbi:hypothetical protein ACH5RR_031528 [Cinchona calisaya]|uniref:Cupin type-1 domain-containing protein n=1 Tax=Cinchona calisaya TaxID=153742 RepID=A0ABD2YGV0_9GENT